MSGGHFDYHQWQIKDISDSIEELLEDLKKPEPPTHKVHYVSIMKQIADGCKRGIMGHNCDTFEGAKRYLINHYHAVEQDGHIYDAFDVWTDKDGNSHKCEYFISEGDYDEYDEGHDECYYGTRYTPETIKEFKKAVKYLKIAYIYAQRVDWLLSGDDGEDNFHERLQKELKEIK